MTTLPAEMSVRVDPEKLGARSFLQKSIADRGDTSAWTDSPAERKRKAMERALASGGAAALNGSAAGAALGLGPDSRPPKRARTDPPIPVCALFLSLAFACLSPSIDPSLWPSQFHVHPVISVVRRNPLKPRPPVRVPSRCWTSIWSVWRRTKPPPDRRSTHHTPQGPTQ
jgi:hypothetical protein